MKKERLDALLTARGLFESRARAQAAIMAGQVLVNEQKIDKPGTQVPEEAAIRLLGIFLPDRTPIHKIRAKNKATTTQSSQCITIVSISYLPIDLTFQSSPVHSAG